jgi:Fe2+ transport system protein FeoA
MLFKSAPRCARQSGAQFALAELGTGECATLIALGHGRGHCGRLASLGFTPGVEIQMLQNYGHGPLVVTVRGTRVALGRGEARKIMVLRREA